jgi:hypothetical protein
MRMRTRGIGRMTSAVLAAAVVAAGCGEDGQGLNAQLALVAGRYSAEGAFGAVAFTTTRQDGTETVDWLAKGASIRLDLHEDMTTSGRLYVPGADEGGGDMDEDLTGTWTLQGNRVSLDHEADTFLRDMDLVFDGERLLGEETWSVTIHVELVRR